jgi:Tannase and feruloyl esterase
MMKRTVPLAIVVGMLGIALLSPLPSMAEPQSCETLAKLALQDTKIESATAINPTPVWEAPSSTNAKRPIRVSAPFCRVVGVIEKEINFEVWLPIKDWNGKYLGVGNGGYGGFINYSSMADSLRRGYATASTDTGHQRTSPNDALWALGHPERIANYGFRAHHLLAETAKRIVSAYYGTGPQHSYFTGCSGGGYDALTEAQRFPEDYDGIVVGDPATSIVRMEARRLWEAKVLAQNPAGRIPPAKVAVITKAVVATCDAQDGVKDGLISNPLGCHFDYSKLQCPGPDAPTCLTPAQVETVKKLYGSMRDSAGKEIYPGPAPATAMNILGPQGERLGERGADFFGYFVFENPKWDWKTSDIESVIAAAEAKVGRDLDSTNPHLKPFEARGGKMILYNGWLDPGVYPFNPINYYQSVEDVMGDKETHTFFRLFLVPGMGHCQGGPGPDVFDKIGVIEQWVEKGKAPDQIIASHITNGKVDRTRPLCPHPERAQYKGTGDTDKAANFVCKSP